MYLHTCTHTPPHTWRLLSPTYLTTAYSYLPCLYCLYGTSSPSHATGRICLTRSQSSCSRTECLPFLSLPVVVSLRSSSSFYFSVLRVYVTTVSSPTTSPASYFVQSSIERNKSFMFRVQNPFSQPNLRTSQHILHLRSPLHGVNTFSTKRLHNAFLKFRYFSVISRSSIFETCS